MIRPGVHTRAHRQSSSAVYHVVRGAGFTAIDGVQYPWEEGDFFAVPPLVRHEHANDGKNPAVLFSLQDVPLLTALGLYREET
jgi:gentisate 1,2-dioxygenase